MAAVQHLPTPPLSHTLRSLPERSPAINIASMPPRLSTAQQQTQRNSVVHMSLSSPVNENGSFEFDRVLKSGYVQKRTRKTKAWKSIYLVLRAQSLSLYKNENESRLRHKILLSDLTAVALLKDPKHKKQNLFGLFSSSRNYHFEAATTRDAQEWVHLVRQEARIEEEEEELYLGSPGTQNTSTYAALDPAVKGQSDTTTAYERVDSSSPEPGGALLLNKDSSRGMRSTDQHRPSYTFDYSGNEMSDLSDGDMTRSSNVAGVPMPRGLDPIGTTSQISSAPQKTETDLERVVWQGHLLYLKTSAGVRQWKDLWVVLRHRNIAIYKDESEYSPLRIIPFSSVINVVEMDPISKSKRRCLQIITEEKSYKLCAHSDEEWDQSLGAFKCLLAKRKGQKLVAATAGT